LFTVGVLSYQGGFQKHLERLEHLNVPARPVRDTAALSEVDALVIPGGESTTIGMLMERFGLLAEVKRRIADGFPVFGTCAGAILLAAEIEESDQPRIGVLDIAVRRNAYGRQIESFEAEVKPSNGSDWSGGAFHGVFIRAPIIVRTGSSVRTVLAFEGKPVLVRSGTLLASTFHPELTSDVRIHRYFLEKVALPEA
jgi:5'-phosphate synthase pdxT subunit